MAFPFSGLKMVDYTTIIFLCFVLIGSISKSYMYIATGLFLIWLIIVFFTSKKSIKSMISDRKTILLVIYLIISFIYGQFVAPIDHCLKVFMEAFMMFSPFLMFDHYKHHQDVLPKVVFILLIAWIGVSIAAIEFYNLIGDMYGESAARVVASDKEAFGGLIIGGGYGIAVGSALLVCIFFNLYLDHHFDSLWEKIFAIIVLIISIMLILKTESTVTTISLVLGVFFTLVFRENGKGNSSKFILIFSVLVLLLSSRTIGEFLIEQSGNLDGVVAKRVASFGATLAGKSEGSEYSTYRFMIPFETLLTFLESPIWGVSYLHGNGFLSPEDFGVGNHGEWSDTLADYGLLGGIPYLLIYIKQVKETNKIGVKFSIGWIVCLFMLGFFNPFRGFQTHIMLFFLIPSLKLYYYNRHNKLGVKK